MTTFNRITGRDATILNNARTGILVLSKKAQLYLAHKGAIDLLEEFAKLRDTYRKAKTLENINRITAWEIEHYGLEEAQRRRQRG